MSTLGLSYQCHLPEVSIFCNKDLAPDTDKSTKAAIQRSKLLYCNRCGQNDQVKSKNWTKAKRGTRKKVIDDFNSKHRSCVCNCRNCGQDFVSVELYNLHLDKCNDGLRAIGLFKEGRWLNQFDMKKCLIFSFQQFNFMN